MEKAMDKVEDAARLRQLLWGRREFIVAAGGALLTVGALALEGCGGGGSSAGGGGKLRSISGVVQFPAGFNANVGTLTVSNGLGSSTVKTNMAFTATGISTGPSLVYVQASTGKAIFTGFVDSTAVNNTLGALSTAAVLVYFALDAYSIPDNSRSEVVKLLLQNSATVTLSKVIEQRILADTFAVDKSDAQIAAAVKVASDAIKGGSKAAYRTSSATATRATILPLLQITPAGQQSGFEINQDTASVGFIGVNHYRRYTKIYTYKTGTVDLTDVQHDLPLALAANAPIPVLSTQNLSLFTAIGDIFKSSSPYAPISSPVVPLALDASTKKTFFDIIVLGSAFSQDEPSFFAAPRYANEVVAWRATVKTLTLKAWFVDILFSLLLDAVGIKDIIINDAAIEAAILSLTTLENAAWQTAIARAQQGLFGPAAKLGMEAIVTDDLVANACFSALLKVIGSAEAAAALAVKGASFKTYVGVALRACVNIVVAAFGALGVGDMAAVAHDLQSSNQGDLWTATLAAPTLLLSPTTATIAPGARVTFTVKPPAGLTGIITYSWTQNGATSTLSSSDGIVGNSIRTTSTSVDLVTTPSDQSAITVNVTAVLKAKDGSTSEIGKAQAIITLQASSGGFNGSVTQKFITEKSYKNGVFDGTYYIYGGYAFSVPTRAWTHLEAFVTGGTAGSLDRADYEGGAPVFDSTTTFISYGHQGGSTHYYNPGDGTVFLFRVLQEPGVTADRIPDATDGLRKIMDQSPVDHITFT